MKKVIDVCFKGNSKKYYFEPIDNLCDKDMVVVETQRGLECAYIHGQAKEVPDEDIVGDLKKVLRKATPKDAEQYEKNESDRPYLMSKVKTYVDKCQLSMKVLSAEYTLDRTKVLVYFTSESRVDFRQLVKELAFEFKARIELWQVGPRDASRIIGGIGLCGRECCCKSHLGSISNVTIKMARNQKLTLNPNAISGLCGKLLCCISYENSQYEDISLADSYDGSLDSMEDNGN